MIGIGLTELGMLNLPFTGQGIRLYILTRIHSVEDPLPALG